MQPARDPVYNYYQILQCIREVRVDAKGWETYFHQRGIEPLRVIYEDFVANPEETLQCIFDFLEIAIPAGFQTPVSQRGADSHPISGWKNNHG
jgi:LPS sulfotransferase NodH